MIELQVIAVEKEGLATEYRVLPDPVIIGAMDSHYEEKLHLTLPKSWKGRNVRVTFTPEMCEGVGFTMDADKPDADKPDAVGGCVPITAAFSGAAPRGVITVEVMDSIDVDGETVTRKTFARDVRYRAIPHATPGEPAEDITPTQFEQFIANVTAATKVSAQAAESYMGDAEAYATSAGNARNEAKGYMEDAKSAAEQAKASADTAAIAQILAQKAQTAAEEAVDGFDEKVTTAKGEIDKKVTTAKGYADTASRGAAAAVSAQSLAQQAQGEAEKARDAAAESEFAATNAAGTLAKKAEQAAASAEKAEQAAIRAESVTAEPEVFIAEHSVTTYEEIKAAYDAGKIVLCKYYSYTGYLFVFNAGANYALFYTHEADDCLYKIVCHATQGWTNTRYAHASKEYVDEKVAELELVSIVTELPETGVENKTYFVAKTDGSGMDLYDEYMWINGAWEYIGTKQIEIDLTEYVKNTDYASVGNFGVVKTASSTDDGIYLNGGIMSISPAPTAHIDARKTKRPITPTNLDYAVKVGITTNTETLTDEEKTAALAWLGANRALDTKKGIVAFAADGTQEALTWAYNLQGNSIARRLGNGTLWVATPDADNAAANKAYVDGLIAELESRIAALEAEVSA